MKTICPVITTALVRECCEFYARSFDASVIDHGEGFARLRFGGFELAFVQPELPRRRPLFQHTTPTRAFSLAIESGNLPLDYDELIRRGLAPLGPLREFEDGQRSFTLIDPAGTVITFFEPRPQPLF